MYFLIIICLLFIFSHATAAVTDEEFAALKAQLGLLVDRVSALETENSKLRAAQEEVEEVVEAARTQTAAAPKRKNEWTDTIAIKGDFRYRYERIDAEFSDARERNRVRARAEISAQPTDNLKLGIGIASGGDSPVSANQTLGGGGYGKG